MGEVEEVHQEVDEIQHPEVEDLEAMLCYIVPRFAPAEAEDFVEIGPGNGS